MRKLLEAVGQLDIDAAVTVGRSMDPATLPAPPNAEIVRLADHDALLPAVDLPVGHGGHGTTMRALAHNVPVLVIPSFDFTDQPAIGAVVTDAGAGRMLPRRHCTKWPGSPAQHPALTITAGEMTPGRVSTPSLPGDTLWVTYDVVDPAIG